MKNFLTLFAALALVLALNFAAAQQSTVAGIPAKLRVQALGVGAGAGAAGTITGGATLNIAATSVQVNGEKIRGESGGNYSGTLTGCTAGASPFISWRRSGNIVTISGVGFSCTSNSALMTITGAPVAIRGVLGNATLGLVPCTNNGVLAFPGCTVYMSSSGILNFAWQGSTFTASGTKGVGDIASQWAFSYDTGG